MTTPLDKAKSIIKGVKDFFKKIVDGIKFFASAIGQIVGWILLIGFIVLLLVYIGKVASRAVAKFVGIEWNYATYQQDLEVIKQLNASGYETSVDAENFQNFKAFEYAVLMDAAEYMRNTRQEMFDIYRNEKEYIYERDLIKEKKPAEYAARIAELSKDYVNIEGGNEPSSVKLLDVEYNTDQKNLLSIDTLQNCIESSFSLRNVIVPGIDVTTPSEQNKIKGGTNRVKGPFLVYEFTNGKGDFNRSEKFNLTVDASSLKGSAKKVWQNYSKEIIRAADKFGLDPYIIISIICVESDGELNNVTWNSKHTEFAFGLMQNYGAGHEGIRSFTDVDGNKIELDASVDAMRDNPQRQIDLGAGDLMAHIREFKYNVHDGCGGYNLGNSGFRKNPQKFDGYWSKVIRYFGGGDETWAIKKENGKYYKVYTNMSTGKITRTEEISVVNRVQESGDGIVIDDTIDDSQVTDNAQATDNISNTNAENQNSGEGNYSNGGGALEPYIYIIKENIEYKYFFNEDNVAIEYPLILNAYNGKLNVGTENAAELNRMLLGIAPVVYPDIDPSNYTKTPYYSNDTTSTTYKIPLRTILGRYMPKAELLNAWSYVKQTVERDAQGDNDSKEKVFMDYVIDSIKGIYNEACLLDESEVHTVKEAISGDTYYYSNDDSHEKTFVTFEKAGIETTKYDIKGLQAIDGEDGDPNIKIVTDFISAIVIQDNFNVQYEIINNISSDGNNENANQDDTSSVTQSKTTGDIELSLADISSRVSFSHREGNYIPAQGNDKDGYIPPSSLEGVEGWYIPKAKEGQVSGIVSQLKAAISDYISEKYGANGGSVTSISFSDEVVKYNPIFITDVPKPVTQKLTIWQARMPALLVSSATTWCRDVVYEHKIIQNQFYQNNRKYIVPKSVSSLGIVSFDTTIVKGGYRGRAYSEVFSKLQEKDVVNMLLQFENAANEGISDANEFMRDLYRLVKSSQVYSNKNYTNPRDERFIHEDTYTYVYIPDSIRYFNDVQSQKVYWLDLLTATEQDPITADELYNMRTKDKELSWQVVEYEKYDECNTGGTTKVYALSPFGSEFVRTYYETMYNKGLDVSGAFVPGSHNGADWTGRDKVNEILDQGQSMVTSSTIPGSIYQYKLKNSSIYGDAKSKLNQMLTDETYNMPIVAIAPGRVETVTYSARSGFYVSILHSKEQGVKSYYMHLKRWPLVNEGDYVGAGTLLGYEGCTGRSFGTHLHFELLVGNAIAEPQSHVFPTFNPFYNEEKAAENGHNLTSEYMSMYRTVTMMGSDSNSKSTITNKVPNSPIITDYDTLIQSQGTIGRKDLIDGELDWNNLTEYENVQAFTKYLESKNYHDLYLEKAFFDEDLALQEGYLVQPLELMSMLNGDITVKVDLPGALPQLTRSDLITILNGWLNDRYPKEDVKWLFDNVFTDSNIDIMLQGEQETKVSIVFLLAAATQEQNLGLSKTSLASPPHCNIFSIKGSVGGGFDYRGDGEKWNSYGNYGEAFKGFMKLISTSEYYFRSGKYTIGTIGPVYCEGNEWAGAVTNLVLEIMKYYPGNWTPPLSGGSKVDAKEWLNLCGRGVQWLYDKKFDYAYSGGYIPYQSVGADGSWVGQTATTIDCSTYVSWMIYEYGVAHNISELKNFGDRASYDFQELAESVKNSPNSGVNKYFTTVWSGMNGLSSAMSIEKIHDLLQPGDILIYRRHTGHVDIFYDWVNPNDKSSNSIYKYSCGSAPKNISAYATGKPYSVNMPMSQPSGNGHGFWDVTAILRLKGVNNGNSSGLGKSGISASSGSVMEISANTITYLKNNDIVYGHNFRVPPYSGLNADGTLGSCNTPSMDCVGYVDWVILEYLNSKGYIPADQMKKMIESGSYTKKYISSTIDDYYDTAKHLAKGQAATKEWEKYFDLVYYQPDKSLGIGYEGKEKLKSMLKPGDILIYWNSKKQEMSHIDIFAGFTGVESSNSIGVNIYSCGFSPKDYSGYASGNPHPYNYQLTGYNSNPEFCNCVAVLRLK